METTSAKVERAGGPPTEQLDPPPRLHFNNPKERSAHIHAFLAWLPKILHEAQ